MTAEASSISWNDGWLQPDCNLSLPQQNKAKNTDIETGDIHSQHDGRVE